MNLVNSVNLNSNYSKLSNNFELRQKKTINQNNNFDSVSFQGLEQTGEKVIKNTKFWRSILASLPVVGGIITAKKEKEIQELKTQNEDLSNKLSIAKKNARIKPREEAHVSSEVKQKLYARLKEEFLPESLKDFACGVTKEGNKYRTNEVREYRYDNDEYIFHEYEFDKYGRLLIEKGLATDPIKYGGDYIRVYDYDNNVFVEKTRNFVNPKYDDPTYSFYELTPSDISVPIEVLNKRANDQDISEQIKNNETKLEALQKELSEYKLEPVKRGPYLFYDNEKIYNLKNEIKNLEETIQKQKSELDK